MSHNSYKGPNPNNLYKDQLFRQVKDYKDSLPDEESVIPEVTQEQVDPDLVKITRSGQVYRANPTPTSVISIYQASVSQTSVSQPKSILKKFSTPQKVTMRKIVELDPFELYALQTALMHHYNNQSFDIKLNNFEKYIMKTGSNNLYPKSSISYKLCQKCSHRKYVQFVFTYKIPKQITHKFYRADLLTVSDHTLSGKEKALLVYRDDPPFPCFHMCSDSL